MSSISEGVYGFGNSPIGQNPNKPKHANPCEADHL